MEVVNVPKLARSVDLRNAAEVPGFLVLDMIGEELLSMHWSCQPSHYVSLDKKNIWRGKQEV